MFLSVIIVSWNVKDKLRENLRALFASRTDFEFEVFVVDNNSEDGTAEMVRAEFPPVNLIENPANFGFGKANNQVIRQSESEFILLLNPDMLVGPDTLQKALDWLRGNRQAAVAGIRLINGKDETIKQVRRFPGFFDQLAVILKLPHFAPGILKNYILEDFDYSRAQVVDSIRGSFFLINRTAINDLKMFGDRTLPLFDERYFLWFEEVDYCRQVKKAGGEVWYTPAAECRDAVGQSFKQVPRGQTQRYFRDSQLKYFAKWAPAWQSQLLSLAWPLGRLLTFLGGKLGGKGGG